MTTVISFLGKGRDDPQKGYRTARYRFPDGYEATTPYFGPALANWLQAERLILLGTHSSMWDVLVEALAVDDAHAEERIALIDATHEGRVDQALLDRVHPLLDRALGRPCRAILIPHGRSNDEQLAILEAIAGELSSGARVDIDITHGYRHLSMIGQVAARHLRHTRSVHVEGIWYGAVEMTDPASQITPVLRLDGLDRIQDWVEAFARFDASGDYGVFAPLLEADGLATDKAQSLVDAHFLESCANLPDARRKLLTVLQALEQPLAGVSRLFQRKLIEKLDWARRDDLGANQRTLALRALDRGDVLRAATLGLESVVTQYCQQRGLDPHDYKQREDGRRQLQEDVRGASDDRWLDAYRTLNGLRNAIAHGTPPAYKPLTQIMKRRDALIAEIRRQIDRLHSRS